MDTKGKLDRIGAKGHDSLNRGKRKKRERGREGRGREKRRAGKVGEMYGESVEVSSSESRPLGPGGGQSPSLYVCRSHSCLLGAAASLMGE